MTTKTLFVSGSAAHPTVGTLLKTTSVQTFEVLATTGLDFIVLDAEHAPFDRRDLDLMMLAQKACAFPALVRLPDDRPATILNVLDLDAAGIIVPHVTSATQAREIVRSARFRNGRRGFSISPRFAGFGTRSRADALDHGDTAFIGVQIEDRDALSVLDDIAAVDGIDALVIGRADLALSMGFEDPGETPVEDAIQQIITAAVRHDKIAALFVSGAAQVHSYASVGASCFVLSTDQALLRNGTLSVLSPIKQKAS